MTDHLPRRDVLAALFAAMASPPGLAAPAVPRGGVPRLADHAALWARMPLPFTPAKAWVRLDPETQAEIGGAVIGMVLAAYVAGDMFGDEDQFTDRDLCEAARDAFDRVFQDLERRLWVLLPELYGPDGEHPAWAFAAGLVR